MLDALWLILLLLANVWLVSVFATRILPLDGWISPISFWLPFYLLNYPVRAALLFAANGSEFERDLTVWDHEFLCGEIVWGLAYATLFAVILLGVYLQVRQSFPYRLNSASHADAGNQPLSAGMVPVFAALFLAYGLVFLYQAASGELFTLYSSLDDLKRPFFVNLLLQTICLKWLLLAYAFLRVQRSKSAFVLVLICGCLMIELCRAVVSTAKGDLVTMVLLWVACFWIVRRRLPVFTMTSAALLILAFALYSHTVRIYGTVSDGGAPLKRTVRENLQIAHDFYADRGSKWGEQAGHIVSRFSYLDAVILIQREGAVLPDGSYVLGSLVELNNVIPRFLWPDRPHLSFNHAMTHAVWKMSRVHFLEMPIGRIGESAFVLNWAGLVYAPLYAIVWYWLYRKCFLEAYDDIGRAFYLSLICLAVIPDAHLIYNWKSLVVVGITAFILRLGDVRRPQSPRVFDGKRPIPQMHDTACQQRPLRHAI